MHDLEAIAWWQFVQVAPQPMSDLEISQLPIKGGVRSKAMAAQSQIRAALLPPDQED